MGVNERIGCKIHIKWNPFLDMAPSFPVLFLAYNQIYSLKLHGKNRSQEEYNKTDNLLIDT